jgi:enterochelin esterase-like enzyme
LVVADEGWRASHRANRELHGELDKLGIPHVYEEFPGGHEWPYWEKHLETTLKFFGAVVARSND